MRGVPVALLASLLLASPCAVASAGASGNETATADQSADKADAAATAAAADKEEFKPPPGFKPKKFGDKILFCQKDTAVGTRFKTEKCFDEAQMRDFMIAQEQSNRDFDRARAICATPAVCRIE